ncbi:MAG: hypothetical protein WKG00_34960 [Polyangiaceae bacterium]
MTLVRLSARAQRWAAASGLADAPREPFRRALGAAGKPSWDALLDAAALLAGARSSRLTGLPPAQVAEHRPWLNIGADTLAAPFAQVDLGPARGLVVLHIDERGTIWSSGAGVAVPVADDLARLVEKLALLAPFLDMAPRLGTLAFSERVGAPLASAIGATPCVEATDGHGAFWTAPDTVLFDGAALLAPASGHAPETTLWASRSGVAATVIEVAGAWPRALTVVTLPPGTDEVRQPGEAPALEALLGDRPRVALPSRVNGVAGFAAAATAGHGDDAAVEIVSTFRGAVVAHRLWSNRGAHTVHYDGTRAALDAVLSSRGAAALSAGGARRDPARTCDADALARASTSSASRPRLRSWLWSGRSADWCSRAAGGGAWHALRHPRRPPSRAGWTDVVPVTGSAGAPAARCTPSMRPGSWYSSTRHRRPRRAASSWRPHLERRALHIAGGQNTARFNAVVRGAAGAAARARSGCHATRRPGRRRHRLVPRAGRRRPVEEDRATLPAYDWSLRTTIFCSDAETLVEALRAAHVAAPAAAVELRVPPSTQATATSDPVLRLPRWDTAERRVAGAITIHTSPDGYRFASE